MSETSKKALLDTDFLFKTQLAQNRNREPLADLIMQFDGYDFFCHEKIISELQTHGFSPDPIPWIEEQVAKGRIQLFSDSRILDEIDELFGSGSPQLYYDMLKTSCDAFPKSVGNSFFTTYYQPLIDLPEDTDKEQFLSTLSACDAAIPNCSSMGEKKSLVLAQLMQLKHPGKLVIFRSDDGRARQRVAYIGNQIRCLSILSTFQKLQVDGFAKDTAREYYASFCSFLSLHHQTGMKVWTHSTSEKINVGFEQLFDDIYAGKFEIKGTGDLRYKE
jgi:hypothetical protein